MISCACAMGQLVSLSGRDFFGAFAWAINTKSVPMSRTPVIIFFMGMFSLLFVACRIVCAEYKGLPRDLFHSGD